MMETFNQAQEVYDLVEDLSAQGSRGIILEIFTSPDGCKSAWVKWIKHHDSTYYDHWIEDCYNLRLISNGKVKVSKLKFKKTLTRRENRVILGAH